LRAKAIKRGQRAAWGDFEDRAIAGAALARCPVEVSVGGLDQPCLGVCAVRAVEAMQRLQRATWSDFEDRAGVAGAALECCPVQVSICGLDQDRGEGCAVRVVEAVQRFESLSDCRSRGRDHEEEHECRTRAK